MLRGPTVDRIAFHALCIVVMVRIGVIPGEIGELIRPIVAEPEVVLCTRLHPGLLDFVTALLAAPRLPPLLLGHAVLRDVRPLPLDIRNQCRLSLGGRLTRARDVTP